LNNQLCRFDPETFETTPLLSIQALSNTIESQTDSTYNLYEIFADDRGHFYLKFMLYKYGTLYSLYTKTYKYNPASNDVSPVIVSMPTGINKTIIHDISSNGDFAIIEAYSQSGSYSFTEYNDLHKLENGSFKRVKNKPIDFFLNSINCYASLDENQILQIYSLDTFQKVDTNQPIHFPTYYHYLLPLNDYIIRPDRNNERYSQLIEVLTGKVIGRFYGTAGFAASKYYVYSGNHRLQLTNY